MRTNIARNVIGGFLIGYGFVAFFCSIYLVEHWAGMAPVTLDAARGLIYPHNEHGTITYFSAFQATSCALLFETSMPLAMIGGLIGPRKNVRVRSGTLWWSATFDGDDPFKVRQWGFLVGIAFAALFVSEIGPSLVGWLNRLGYVQHF